MRARERQRLEWRRTAARHLRCAFAGAVWDDTTVRDRFLRAALRIITIHGPVPLRPQAKELLGRLG